jgi:acetoin utilization protein AcuB
MALDLRSADVHSIMVSALPVITPKTTIATALRLMREHGISTLPVSSDAGLQGLVTEKALLRFTPSEATTLDVYELRDVLDRLTVERATVAPRAVVSPDAGLEEAAALMLRTDADVIAVMDAGRFIGLVTWCGLLAAAVGAPRPA